MNVPIFIEKHSDMQEVCPFLPTGERLALKYIHTIIIVRIFNTAILSSVRLPFLLLIYGIIEIK
jgi:hypothetical protein